MRQFLLRSQYPPRVLSEIATKIPIKTVGKRNILSLEISCNYQQNRYCKLANVTDVNADVSIERALLDLSQ